MCSLWPAASSRKVYGKFKAPKLNDKANFVISFQPLCTVVTVKVKNQLKGALDLPKALEHTLCRCTISEENGLVNFLM